MTISSMDLSPAAFPVNEASVTHVSGKPTADHAHDKHALLLPCAEQGPVGGWLFLLLRHRPVPEDALSELCDAALDGRPEVDRRELQRILGQNHLVHKPGAFILPHVHENAVAVENLLITWIKLVTGGQMGLHEDDEFVAGCVDGAQIVALLLTVEKLLDSARHEINVGFINHIK